MDNKKDLIRAVASKSWLTQVDSEKAIEALTAVIFDELVKGSEVTVRDLGKFKLSRRKARNGFNPRTAESIRIEEMNVAKFVAGSKLKKAVKFVWIK